MNSKITFDTIEELYKTAKTDRYTQDAYQVGEISRKTGLQKQSDGTWAPPKNGHGSSRSAKADHPKRRDSDILSNRDYTESNKAYAERSRQLHEKADKERAERNANAENKTSAIMQEAKERNLSGPQLKDFVFSKIWEGQNIDHVQSSMEAQDWSLTEADDGINVYEKPDGSKVTMQLEGSKVKSVDYSAPPEEIGRFLTKFDDKQSAYDAGRQTYPEGGYTIFKTPTGQFKVVDDPKTKQRMTDAGYEMEVDVPSGTKPPKNPAPKTESVSSRRMQKDLDGNFWSRPEDFKEDITSRGWDVEEMNSEYAVISNEAGSQYEVRFDDHSDDGDLTVRTFKPLMIDEDDEDEGIEDARRYEIGQVSEKTGLVKTANGWRNPSETKFGKVVEKNGQFGVQQKLGKNSSFIPHKSEADAKSALKNYTRGFNTTERSKQDPHSDKARLAKHWDQEVEKMRKDNKLDSVKKGVVEHLSKHMPKENAEKFVNNASPKMIRTMNHNLNFKMREESKKLKGSKDAAPRQLTGDTKIRVRK